MSEHIVKNNPMREFTFALGGVGLFLAIVLLIGISGYLRPAGEHITAEPEEAAVTEAAPVASAAAPAAEEAAVSAETPAAEAKTTVPADATVTPAPDTGDAIVATGSATATADGTVDQKAAEGVDVTAEQADGDVDAGTTDKADQ